MALFSSGCWEHWARLCRERLTLSKQTETNKTPGAQLEGQLEKMQTGIWQLLALSLKIHKDPPPNPKSNLHPSASPRNPKMWGGGVKTDMPAMSPTPQAQGIFTG